MALLGVFFGALSASAQTTTIELESSQSMCITGKGPGQDGAINPYTGSPSTAIVTNLGEERFNVRIQKNAEILRTISVSGSATEEIALNIGEEMYFDSTLPTNVKIAFREGIPSIEMDNEVIETPEPRK